MASKVLGAPDLETLNDHYISVAPHYDKFHGPLSIAMAKFIQNLIPKPPSDQIVDVGGGTGHCARVIKANLGMTQPVVCVDPSQDMLDVAKKTGAITVRATAEEFFASKPCYPLKLVLMNGCIHLFSKPDFVYSQLAQYMPEDGVCIITRYSLPTFTASKKVYAAGLLEEACKVIKSKGLKCKIVSETECVQFDKMVWLEAMRSRYSTSLIKISDEQLEEGIKELEETYKGQSVINYMATMYAAVVTKA